MTGRLEGKVALVTGAARGQGRSHSVRLAQEGADIVAIDLCGPVDSIDLYPPATEEDLAETARLVEELDRRVVTAKADVRDAEGLRAAVDAGVAEVGRLDIVCANAGVLGLQPALELSVTAWHELIDVNLTGVWNTCQAALPHLLAGGRGGSIVITSSTGGLKGLMNAAHYVTAKHGLVGMMRALANEFAPHSIRCNTVHPTTVDTLMIQNDGLRRVFDPANPSPTRESIAPIMQNKNALPVPWVEPVDVSNAVLFLASDEARYITGVTLPVDAGYTVK
ncbi:mycofactocin-coupled SDR family oxidoreductase [Pseudonocardia sp. T1-2H]|uniref:mycofactocin-coupled SDR family oxidoreductase n=1 Tax=Pseudonocardia sp. T1-2H TaxID=3128899 RepID=UPI0031016A44